MFEIVQVDIQQRDLLAVPLGQPDGVERDLGTLFFLEQRFFRRPQAELSCLARGDILHRQHMTVRRHPVTHGGAVDARPHDTAVFPLQAELCPRWRIALRCGAPTCQTPSVILLRA